MKQTGTRLTADDALALAKLFRLAAIALGDYLYENWEAIPKKNRDILRSLEVSLLNHATDLVTRAVGIVLVKGQGDLKDLADATTEARKALETVGSAKKAIKIATTLTGLAAAIPTGNPESIYAAYNALNATVLGDVSIGLS